MMIHRGVVALAISMVFGCGGTVPENGVTGQRDTVGSTSHSLKGDPGGPKAPALCTAPWGVDLCAATGVTAAWAFPAYFGGAPVPAGNWWTLPVGWGVNAAGGLPGLPLTYHPGYVTSFPDDPTADFISKFVMFRVVVDPGTHQERTYEFRNPAQLERIMTIAEFWGSGGLGTTAIDDGQWIAYVPIFHPLSVGEHEIHLIYTLSAESCDGFPSTGGEPITFEGGHCLPAGDFAIAPDWHPWPIAFAPR